MVSSVNLFLIKGGGGVRSGLRRYCRPQLSNSTVPYAQAINYRRNLATGEMIVTISFSSNEKYK